MLPPKTTNAAFDFANLFVLDLANNHQGDIEHGLNVVRAHGEVVRRHGVRAALKFQFRQLDTFIHPEHKSGSKAMHIERFQTTRLGRDAYERMFEEARVQGMMTMCTPFDEESVSIIAAMGFDIIKVASCSATDWPLLEAIARTGLPVIASTGGLLQDQVDNLVSFFEHRGVDFAIMHCVSIYPTPDAQCHLNNIETFRRRYPGKAIGWSTHEDPGSTAPIQIACAKGALMFERHIGLPTETIKLNAYSSTPEQIDEWLAAWHQATDLLGSHERQHPAQAELDSIDSLRRGVFARTPIASGEIVSRDQVYFAMPYVADSLSSSGWQLGIRAQADIPADAPLTLTQIKTPTAPAFQVLKSAIHEIKALLNEAGVVLGSEFELEYSHHYGIENFAETGAVLINCINREYCKKIIVQIAGQSHPSHYHKRTEETFQILWGELWSEVDGRQKLLKPGDTQLVLPGVWHRFWSETGCVFEEISTTHFNNDSVYRDTAINNLERHERKTIVDHWGRFQLIDAVAETSDIAQNSDLAPT